MSENFSEKIDEKLEPSEVYLVSVGTYEDYVLAEADYKHVVEAENSGELPNVSIALISKDEKGRLHVHQSTFAGKAGALFGMCAGAAVGVLFPPAGLALIASTIGAGAVLGVGGGLIGHFAGGVSRHSLRKLGTNLEAGAGAVVMVTTSRDWSPTLLPHAAVTESVSLDAHDVAQASHAAREYLEA